MVEVSYDELVTRPLLILEQVYMHIGVRWNPVVHPLHFQSELDGIGTHMRNCHRELSVEMKEMLSDRWRSYFEAFGYNLHGLKLAKAR